MGGAYAASLCWGGITGGCLLIQPGGLLFTTQKIQVPKDKRRIFIPFADLRAVGRSRVLGFRLCGWRPRPDAGTSSSCAARPFCAG